MDQDQLPWKGVPGRREADGGLWCASAGCRTSNDGLLHGSRSGLSWTIAAIGALVYLARGEIIVVVGHNARAIKACHGGTACIGDGQWTLHLTHL
ncbi:hypothetical protein HPP92_001693 [Vanilla planifolia]|uniref:Uncharacterized protein n=1 Tax=Vanilla planifolia TaxID=51239 RepID=A0A835VFK7_VANPL|nr:hypothetical protein HPP92_001693 [Vanilla planifolia]